MSSQEKVSAVSTSSIGRLSDRASSIPESSTVRIADLALRLRAAGESVADLSAGRASEATDPEICAAATRAMASGHTHQTPARGLVEFREAVAEKLERRNGLQRNPYTEIMATLGCKNGLLLSLLAILDADDEVLIEDPCFVSYAPTITLCGGVPVPVSVDPAEGWRLRAEDLEQAVTSRTKVIILCSPGNPTGAVHTAEDLTEIAQVAKKHNIFVISDEIYEAVTWGGRQHVPIASLAGMRDLVIGLMGMTKSYSMGGWRTGYAYGPADVIERMVMVQQHIMTCASSLGQHAGIVALSAEVTQRLAETTWLEWERRCNVASAALNDINGLSVAPPEGGFYAWIDISETGIGSEAFSVDLLQRYKVAVVPGNSFGASTDHFVRATCVRSEEELSEGIRRIADFVGRLGADSSRCVV